jgi:nucleotide-binding universal stress UspA family protein
MTDDTREAIDTSHTPRLGGILVPVDGSPASLQAVEYAAQLRPERITLLRVELHEPVDTHVDPADPYQRWRHGHLSTVMTELEELGEANASGADTIESKIRFGNPAEQIMAEAHDHDLIVIGATGKGAAGRLLFGSVTDRVMRYALTPTLVVRSSRDGARPSRPLRVVVPLDGSELAEHALPVASRIARMLSLPIRLIRCVGMDDVLETIREARRSGESALFDASEEPYKLGQERADHEASTYLESVRERLGLPDLPVSCDRLMGSAAFELLWDVTEDDLVIMTSRGEGGLRRWMIGSVAEKMVREAKAPVLLVPVGRVTDSEGT